MLDNNIYGFITVTLPFEKCPCPKVDTVPTESPGSRTDYHVRGICFNDFLLFLLYLSLILGTSQVEHKRDYGRLRHVSSSGRVYCSLPKCPSVPVLNDSWVIYMNK